jgi:hypothetical protein
MPPLFTDEDADVIVVLSTSRTDGVELREDGGVELREDGSVELREV